MTQSIEKTFSILNKAGLHARAAALLVQTASRFKSQVTVVRGGEEVNGKSIMGIMMLAATSGSKIKVRAKGEDAEAVMAALEDLIERKFDEE